jgi:Fe2+ transport system protein B
MPKRLFRDKQKLEKFKRKLEVNEELRKEFTELCKLCREEKIGAIEFLEKTDLIIEKVLEEGEEEEEIRCQYKNCSNNISKGLILYTGGKGVCVCNDCFMLRRKIENNNIN